MKFLCDVHISFKIVKFLISKDYECIHVNSILDKWFTKDNEIAKFADKHDLILISKDTDFRDSFYLKNTPSKLLKVNLGNISNSNLINIIDLNLDKIEKLNSKGSFILEINDDNLTFSSMKIIS